MCCLHHDELEQHTTAAKRSSFPVALSSMPVNLYCSYVLFSEHLLEQKVEIFVSLDKRTILYFWEIGSITVEVTPGDA